jgi:hypothetical protein
MTRRRKFAAIAVVAAGLIFVGLGARNDDVPEMPTAETCKTDLEAVFEYCEDVWCPWPTRKTDDEVEEACQAGCVMSFCPEQITCTELDPMWCGASCVDPYGGRYWRDDVTAVRDCERFWDPNGDGHWDDAQRRAWTGCIYDRKRELCPALPEREEWPSRKRVAE